MADGLLTGGGPESETAAPERTGWAAEEEPAALGKGLFEDEDSCSDCSYHDKPGTSLQSFVLEGKTPFPEIFQTSQLLFYERFRAYQDYILGEHYDILEDRVPSGLIVDYRNLLSQCEESYRKFLNLRSSLSNCNSDSEQENISMVEGLKLYSEMEQLKQKLKLIENPLLRYVFGYQKNSNIQAKGIRPSGQKVTHVVSSTMTTGLLRSLLSDRLCQEPCEEETEIQFHRDPLSAINACYEGDSVIVCPGHYVVHGTFSIADSIELEESKAFKIQTSGEADATERVDLEELIQCATGKMELCASSDLSEHVEGNCEIINELVAASTQKGQMKKKRLSELGITQADDNLMSQEMFVGIVGNQFKWNGKGSFGTFLF
ncbi:PREDICTED: SHC SH2 domain-binding protein 1 [Propithecus coquereli]|uniref:SHC SH2 domain-binding protein 1 n=1 Tax=Propithecus coquereli TaxID=379532 RepID=UPI00063F75E6|nr:PREDICTED: SHC SH2 domain-binding protein 1 [Propithecus coquereli]